MAKQGAQLGNKNAAGPRSGAKLAPRQSRVLGTVAGAASPVASFAHGAYGGATAKRATFGSHGAAGAALNGAVGALVGNAVGGKGAAVVGAIGGAAIGSAAGMAAYGAGRFVGKLARGEAKAAKRRKPL